MPKTQQTKVHPFQAYLKTLTPAQRDDLAEKCGTSYDYMRKLCGPSGRRPSINMAKLLEQHTGIDKAVLRPDVWELPKGKEAA